MAPASPQLEKLLLLLIQRHHSPLLLRLHVKHTAERNELMHLLSLADVDVVVDADVAGCRKLGKSTVNLVKIKLSIKLKFLDHSEHHRFIVQESV